MNVRKFIAPTSKEALRQVRDALGDDAVVLSSRAITGGVEIIALAGPELDQLTGPKKAAAAKPAIKPSVQPASPQVSVPAPPSPTSLIEPAKISVQPAVPMNHKSSETPSQSLPVADSFSQQFGAFSKAMAPPKKKGGGAALAAYASSSDDLSEDGDDFEEDSIFQRSHIVEPKSSKPVVEDASVASMKKELPQRPIRKKRPFHERVAADPIEKTVTQSPSIEPIPPIIPEWLDEPPPKVIKSGKTEKQNGGQLTEDDISSSAPIMPNVAPPAVSKLEDESLLALRAELQTMRDLLEKQLAHNAAMSAMATPVVAPVSSSPIDAPSVVPSPSVMPTVSEDPHANQIYADVLRTLLSAGFGGQLCKNLLEDLPPNLTPEQGLDWARQALERHIPVIDNEDVFLGEGGIFALVGPTGVGKTTTTAKLAARAVMRFGPGKVALLSTDSFRIGAHEQLRIYGRILGIPVHVLDAPEDFGDLLSELADKRVVLIDTVGMSQRDRTVPEQLAMLQHEEHLVKRLLLLNATSHGDTLNEVVRAYKGAAGQRNGLTGCIITKIDEATRLGGAIDCVIRHRLPVHYVSTGQRVPEHLYLARKNFLVRSALMLSPKHSPFVLEKDEFSTLLASVSGNDSDEVNLG